MRNGEGYPLLAGLLGVLAHVAVGAVGPPWKEGEMGLRERLRRLEREVERANAPTWVEDWAAARRDTARRLSGVYERLARIPGNGPRRTPGVVGNFSPTTPRRGLRQTAALWRRGRGRMVRRTSRAQRTKPG